MKAIITDYQYENVNQEKSLIEGAGYMLVAHTTSTPKRLSPQLQMLMPLLLNTAISMSV